MLEKTSRLVTQCKVLKKQIMPESNTSGIRSNPNPSENTAAPSDSRSTSSDRTSENPGLASRPRPPTESLKRTRASDEDSGREAAVPESSGYRTVRPETLDSSSRSQKRKRLDKLIPGADEDVRNVTPMSIETEDISEEVQRRLEIKDRQRKKRSATKVDKRKRDSMTSNGSTSSPGTVTRHPKKKARVGTSRDR
ncbi:hypothetical protein BO71DRAFT_395247 [Aspergillus ellipticus CBS 707.79]|uniref:Uncharacterized protein n=1 Tax=Aspergillus ellipticus CBS 707.79 TaxID=1448320 RepID=A0A319E420_9EURO|nr:hypothetical protein BO71DRAFT_395247 [Aspergillus ellipticus CBS 707.79]